MWSMRPSNSASNISQERVLEFSQFDLSYFLDGDDDDHHDFSIFFSR